MTRSMTTTGIFIILASLASLVFADMPIGLQAITQFDQLATLRYGVRTHQASSRDPTGGNEDAYQYLQVIGDEQVLMDVKGPGCVYRIWMTGFESTKYIKIYLDGSSTPTVNRTMSTFFSGTSSPFLSPLVGNDRASSGGFYCYLPIPFREGCRITSTGARYYQITYQTYSSADGITTFTGSEDSSTARSMWNNSGSDPKSDHGSLTATGTVSIPVGQTVTLADINSAGSIQQIEFNIPGLSAGNVTDDGRAYTGYSQFRMTVDPSNQGVRLKRRLHYAVGDQKARVTVDGVVAGEWYTPGAAESWLISTFNIPSNLTAGKSSLLIRIDFISSAMDWNEFYYWAYSIVGGNHLLTDQLNVGNSTSESSHNYTVSGQAWSGSRTLPSEWKSILPGLGLRIYWDGSGSEAVNANMCDFFGTGLGPYRVDALPVGIDGTRLYCFFPMPFSSRALVRIGNYGTMDADQITYTICYNTLASPPSNVGRFHAKYLSQAPVTVGQDYKVLDLGGSGHFVGVTHTMIGPDTNRNYLEGDERIYVDGSKTPQIYGTGTEDFYNGGWYFSRGTFTLPVHGNAAHEVGTRDATSCYRFLLSDMIPFTTSLKVGFETYVSGSDYYSVAYYYLSPTALATLTDTLDVRNTTSESAHSYTRTGETWSGTSSLRFEGDDDGVTVSDDGRRIGLGGTSQFTMAIQPTNGGVMLRRRLDYRWPRQQARIFVDGTPVGIWYDAGKNDTLSFRESEFLIPAPLTNGKSNITIRTENISSESDWTEYRYWAYTYYPDPSIAQAPVIAEVSPDPDIAAVGMSYTRQLNLLQGSAPITWSVISGPSGAQVNSSGYVSGWTPNSSQGGTSISFTVRAANAQGYDDESWQVYVHPLPDQTIANFPFDGGAQGWTLEVWKSGDFENGTLVWDSASGNPGGNMKSTGSGGTNNDNSCTREGSQMTRTISTLSYTNIQIEYDVVAILNTAPVSGCVGGCLETVLEGSCEDKLVVYYSTTGTGGPWIKVHELNEGDDLPTSWTHKTISLVGVTTAENNANFALRFTWQFNTTTDTGRIDNITVKGSGGPTNIAPQVNAGTDQTITLPSSANLDGTVSDDGLPNPPGAVTVTWSKTSGPGTVTFGNANTVDTTASFSTAGTYVLRLTASDSVLSAYDEVTITVNAAPSPPGKATNPNPADGAIKISTSSSLSWTAGTGATSHKIYFGTTNPPTYQTQQTGTTYDPGPLNRLTPHYWRIDEVNAQGTTTGDLWTFTTNSAPGDFDLDGDVDLEDFGYLQRCYSGNDVPPITGCTEADLDNDNDVDTNDFIIFKNCVTGQGRPPGC